MSSIDWNKRATGLLKAELAKQDISYIELSTRLESLGIKKTPGSLSVAINRGTFSFAFFLQCMKAINSEKIILD